MDCVPGHVVDRNDALKGRELESDNHPAFIYKLAPLRNVVIQFDFRFDRCSEITVSTNHNDHGGHNSRVVISSAGFIMNMDLNLIDPADSGAVLGQCACAFERGKGYPMQVEYRGDEMLARVDEITIILGAHSYIDQACLNIRFPLKGDSASFDNIKAWKV